MTSFNRAYQHVLARGRLTVGLMTPAARPFNGVADADLERRIAQRADHHGFASLWTRDVPLAIPQGEDGEASGLDDPFVWLAGLAASTQDIALGTAAAVLPLREPLHLAKAALSLDRLSSGRFILGLGSGDRPAEFAAFERDHEDRGELFRHRWPLLRSALSPVAGEREALTRTTGGFDVLAAPTARVPMVVVGSARQSLQWVATHADAWATYHRDELRQQGRMELWWSALRQRAGGQHKPFIQSLHLDLLDDPHAPAQPLPLGMRTGRLALSDYLRRMEAAGVSHVLLHLARGQRPVMDVVDELGLDVLPQLRLARADPAGVQTQASLP
jgi:luciferase-type oxidoreductase